MVKKYYIVEPIDIDGDKNNDGFLVSQYKFDKYNNKIFLKNKYITFSKLKSYIKKGGQGQTLPQQQSNLVVLTPEQFNQLMNNRNMNPSQFQNQFQNQYPPVVVRDNNSGSFGSSLGQGFAMGAGVGIGSELTSSIFDSIFG